APAVPRGCRVRRSPGTPGARACPTARAPPALAADPRDRRAAPARSRRPRRLHRLRQRVETALELDATVVDLLVAGIRRHFERLAELDEHTREGQGNN